MKAVRYRNLGPEYYVSPERQVEKKKNIITLTEYPGKTFCHLISEVLFVGKVDLRVSFPACYNLWDGTWPVLPSQSVSLWQVGNETLNQLLQIAPFSHKHRRENTLGQTWKMDQQNSFFSLVLTGFRIVPFLNNTIQ